MPKIVSITPGETYGTAGRCKCQSRRHRSRYTVVVSSASYPDTDRARCQGLVTMSHLVVDPERELLGRVGHVGGVAEAVDSQAACELLDIRWDIPRLQQRKYIPIGGRNTLMSPRVINWYCVRTARPCYSSVGAGRSLPQDSCHRCTQRATFEECPRLRLVSRVSQGRPHALARKPTDAKSLGDSGQIPDWFNCELCHGQLARSVLADLAIRHTIQSVVSEFAIGLFLGDSLTESIWHEQ